MHAHTIRKNAGREVLAALDLTLKCKRVNVCPSITKGQQYDSIEPPPRKPGSAKDQMYLFPDVFLQCVTPFSLLPHTT